MTTLRPRAQPRCAALAAALAAGLALTGCNDSTAQLPPSPDSGHARHGTSDAAGATEDGASHQSAVDHEAMGHGPADHEAKDHGALHHAPPAADEVAGAELATGNVAPLDTAPPGSEGITGEALVARHEGGATATLRLRGLEPLEPYVAYLHARTCAQDAGGEHVEAHPPGHEGHGTEVQLPLIADAAGVGEVTIATDHRVGDVTRSVVLHSPEMLATRLACADLSS